MIATICMEWLRGALKKTARVDGAIFIYVEKYSFKRLLVAKLVYL